MTRFFKRLLFALGTLGLGALAYALLRAEDGGESAPTVRTSEPAEPSRPRATTAVGQPEPASEPSAEPARCAGTTKSGKRCSREAEPGSKYCWQHGA